jgi:hypothetical protein
MNVRLVKKSSIYWFCLIKLKLKLLVKFILFYKHWAIEGPNSFNESRILLGKQLNQATKPLTASLLYFWNYMYREKKIFFNEGTKFMNF